MGSPQVLSHEDWDECRGILSERDFDLLREAEQGGVDEYLKEHNIGFYVLRGRGRPFPDHEASDREFQQYLALFRAQLSANIEAYARQFVNTQPEGTVVRASPSDAAKAVLALRTGSDTSLAGGGAPLPNAKPRNGQRAANDGGGGGGGGGPSPPNGNGPSPAGLAEGGGGGGGPPPPNGNSEKGDDEDDSFGAGGGGGGPPPPPPSRDDDDEESAEEEEDEEDEDNQGKDQILQDDVTGAQPGDLIVRHGKRMLGPPLLTLIAKILGDKLPMEDIPHIGMLLENGKAFDLQVVEEGGKKHGRTFKVDWHDDSRFKNPGFFSVLESGIPIRFRGKLMTFGELPSEVKKAVREEVCTIAEDYVGKDVGEYRSTNHCGDATIAIYDQALANLGITVQRYKGPFAFTNWLPGMGSKGLVDGKLRDWFVNDWFTFGSVMDPSEANDKLPRVTAPERPTSQGAVVNVERISKVSGDRVIEKAVTFVRWIPAEGFGLTGSYSVNARVNVAGGRIDDRHFAVSLDSPAARHGDLTFSGTVEVFVGDDKTPAHRFGLQEAWFETIGPTNSTKVWRYAQKGTGFAVPPGRRVVAKITIHPLIDTPQGAVPLMPGTLEIPLSGED